MAVIVKGEFMKLKRYFIVWIGVSLMLLNVLLTLFTSLAEDGMKWDFQFLCEQVIKNFVTMIFIKQIIKQLLVIFWMIMWLIIILLSK